jgi:glutamine kinase
VVNSHFRFATKASNLHQLEGLINSAYVLPQVVFTVSEWRETQERCIEAILRLNSNLVIVRSSAPMEDSQHSSYAGAFESIINVNVRVLDELKSAVLLVIESYEQVTSDINDYEILVQPMLENVLMSGVCFTRDLDKFGPYYVLNYDDLTGQTDSVTAGRGSQKTIRVFKYADAKLSSPIDSVIEMVKELEYVTQNQQIDIEFAVDSQYHVCVLQVRPLVGTKIFHYQRVDAILENKVQMVSAYLENTVQSSDEHIILGQMPDWNPAEIIGAHPKPMAYSLYRELVMKHAWREGRKYLGYSDVFPIQLMHNLAGRPYVDLRASFSSLIPKQTPKSLSEKLIRYYCDKLKANPHFHDKVEFEIVTSCLTFNNDWSSLLSAGFSQQEVNRLQSDLLELTNHVVEKHSETMKWLNECTSRLNAISVLRVDRVPIQGLTGQVRELIDICMEFGTSPFAAIARQAFIGSSILRSLQELGILSTSRVEQFYKSLRTVSSEFSRDLSCYNNGSCSLEVMIERYGHLRPGTYDITSLSYDEQPEFYLQRSTSTAKMDECEVFAFTDVERQEINRLIKVYNFKFDADSLLVFIVESLEWREYVKFVFSKIIDAIFKLLMRFGEYHGISRGDLAYLDISDITKFACTAIAEEDIRVIKDTIAKQRSRYEMEQLLYMPEIIFSVDDCKAPTSLRAIPNFITQKNITAELLSINDPSEINSDSQYEGKIILIENADPGYDWLFTKNIAGLITKYGGVASHMAIRCAEFGLPAAIGCGELLYEQIKGFRQVNLNCQDHRIS